MKVYTDLIEITNCGECPNCKVTGIPEDISDWNFYCQVLQKQGLAANVKKHRNDETISPYCPLEDFQET